MTKLLQKLGLGARNAPRKPESSDPFEARLVRIGNREAQVRHNSALFRPASQPQEA